jgi:hypothetical protein
MRVSVRRPQPGSLYSIGSLKRVRPILPLKAGLMLFLREYIPLLLGYIRRLTNRKYEG